MHNTRVTQCIIQNLIKCYEITPSADTKFDSIIVEAGESWQRALDNAEDALEKQYLDTDKPWDGISVTIKCVYKTREELNDLENVGGF